MDNRIKNIADTYGLNSQLDILQEECAELIQAVSKYRRGGSFDLALEEMADVEIMLEQIRYLISEVDNITVDNYKNVKLDRQIRRIEESQNDT